MAFSPTTRLPPPFFSLPLDPITVSSSGPSGAMDLILLFRFMDAWWAEIYQKNGDSSWIKMMMKWGQMSLLNWLIAYSLLHCFICCWVIRKRPLVLFTKSISINRIAIVIRDAFHLAFLAYMLHTKYVVIRWMFRLMSSALFQQLFYIGLYIYIKLFIPELLYNILHISFMNHFWNIYIKNRYRGTWTNRTRDMKQFVNVWINTFHVPASELFTIWRKWRSIFYATSL